MGQPQYKHGWKHASAGSFLQPTLPLLVGFLQNLLDKLGIPLKLRIANTVRRLERTVLVTEGGNKGTERVNQGVCRDYVDSLSLSLSFSISLTVKINLNCQYLPLKKYSLIALTESFRDSKTPLGRKRLSNLSIFFFKTIWRKAFRLGKN